MDRSKLTRREMLRMSAVAAIGAVAAACGGTPVPTPTPVVITKVETKVVKEEVTKVVEKSVEKVITATPVPAATPKPLGAETIQLLMPKYDSWMPGMDASNAQYAKLANGGKVEIIMIAAETNAKLLPLCAAGTPPDISIDASYRAGVQYANDTYLTINDWISGVGLKQTDFVTNLDCFSIFGKNKMINLWGGLGGGPRQFEYRKDMFEQAGIPFPDKWSQSYQTWDEWMQVAQKLTKRDSAGKVTQWGYDHMDPIHSGDLILGGLLDMGGQWYDESKKQFLINTDKFIQAVRIALFDPVYKYGVAFDDANKPKEPRIQRMLNGITAMAANGYAYYEAQAKKSDVFKLIELAQMPGMAAGKGNIVFNGEWGIGLIKIAPASRRASAMKWLEAHLNDDVMAVWHDKVGPASGLKRYYPVAGQAGHAYWQTVKGKMTADEWSKTVASMEYGYKTPMRYIGWEWGDQIMIYWPQTEYRCNRRGGKDRCAQTGTLFSGKITVEQLCEEWQKEATAVRAEWFAAAGVKE